MKLPRELVNWALMALLAFYASRLVDSVDTLNVKMAEVITIIGQHEKRLDKLEERTP